MSGQNTECGKNGEKHKKIIAYMLVGFSLFNTLLIGMNGAPFSLDRFKIPGNYYSLYVSRLHNCMELACFVGVVLGNLYILPVGKECGYISIAINWSSFIVNIVLLVSYVTGGENGHLTFFYWTLAGSATIYGFNLQFIYKLGGKCMVYFMVAIPISSVSTSLIHYVVLSIFGNRRKYNTEFIILTIEITISIIFTGLTASMWSVVYTCENSSECNNGANGSFQSHVISPILMTSVALSLIYVYYPGIAPGLLVDFIYVHKIDLLLMLVVPIPSIIIALLSHHDKGPDGKWDSKIWWHGFVVFIVSMIVCSILFTISLHYPQSAVSRSIVNRPFMTGFLTILFYISHEIMLAVGFPSITGNWNSNAATGNGLLTGTGVIVFVLLGEGYITEYKRHDPSKWPTDGMATRTAFSYWMSRSFANALDNVKRIFTLDVRRDILKSVRKIELI
uniref:Tpr-related protein family member, putative n=1 Tax=Theileria annulata TaxID=5874 RepID=A0A3B0N0F0_THEAN